MTIVHKRCGSAVVFDVTHVTRGYYAACLNCDEDLYTFEVEKEMTDRPWYGVVSRVNFMPGGADDPSLAYRGHEFNYWDIEESIIDMYQEDLRENYPDDEYLVMVNFEVGGDPHDDNWIDWLRDNADRVRVYLDELIDGGAPKTWKN